MNSLHLIRKTIIFGSSTRFSRLYLNIHNYNVQTLCSVADVKSYLDSCPKNLSSDSKSFSSSTQNCAISHEFGSRKVSVEKKFRSKHNSSTSSIKYEKKRIIKINKSQNEESDVFGNLSENRPMWYSYAEEESKDDNDLSDDSIIVKNLNKKFRCPKKYLEEMKRLVKEKKVKDALDLFVDMKRNFVTPLHAHYTYMIGVCGKVGYTEMAFKLLRQMTDRSFRPTPATLTGLFNSCAESPFPEYGLKKANLLKEKIEEKNWMVTQITYHAMIKAFGKCGDLQTAFKIVDEMVKANIKIDISTYSFLLMSCISNKEAGFTYAVEVCRKMKARKCLPNIFTCNLLLRATRDCDVGPEEISCLLLQHWSNYSKRPYGFMTKESLSKKPVLKLSSNAENNVTETFENQENVQCQVIEEENKKLNESSEEDASKCEIQNAFNRYVTPVNSKASDVSVLSARPINGPEILEIVNIKTPSDRLSLIGGMEGFLEFMFESKVKPDIKTFTLLLECLPDNSQEEEKLLSLLDNYQINPDIDFFNVLIKRRNFRKETIAARNVLLLINKYELVPDIMTFGALALGCRTLHQASIFISEMKKFGSFLNTEIAGCMVRSSSMVLDFSYMKYILKLMEEHEIKPNEKILSTMEKALSDAKKNIILMEQGKEVNKFYQRKNLQSDFKKFLSFYEEWLKRVKFESEKHPWLQYQTDIIDRTKEEQYIQ